MRCLVDLPCKRLIFDVSPVYACLEIGGRLSKVADSTERFTQAEVSMEIGHFMLDYNTQTVLKLHVRL